MTPKGKNVPCEGCRERKKKCSAGQPCDRCERLGIDCHYLKTPAPPDLEYVDIVNSCELEATVEELQRLMANMEDEMLQLQRSPAFGKMAMTHSRSSSTESLMLSSSSSSSCSSLGSVSSDGSVSRSSELAAVKTRKPVETTLKKNWRLTLGEYGLRIETDIRSFDDLLHNVRTFGIHAEVPSLHKQPSFELPYIPRYAVSTVIRHTQFRAIQHCVETNNALPAPNPINNTFHPIKDLPLELLDIYFSCQFLYSVDLHRPTFYAMFVDNAPELNDSPVICALCADIITMRCRDVQHAIPFNQQVAAHTYYYNRARELIAPYFDSVALEPYLTYLFLARHFTNLVYPKKARQCIEIALRIRHLLVDEYSGSTVETVKAGACELFKRSHAIIRYVAMKNDFYNNQRGIPMRSMAAARQKARSMTAEVRQEINRALSHPTPMPDDTPRERRFLMHSGFVNTISTIVRPYLSHSRSPSKVSIPLELLIRTEQSLNRYFLKEMPPEYRLQRSIFENDLSDNEFRDCIRSDPNIDACSAMLTIRYYQARITLHEPFLPTLPEQYRKMQQKIFALSSAEEVSYSTPPPPGEEGCTRDQFTMRALEVCHRSAVFIVRLLEYLVLDQHMCCDVMLPCFLSAWDIHVRNACLGFADTERAQKHVPVQVVRTSRDYVMRCIRLLKKGYHYNPGDRPLWQHHQVMEDELLQALFATRPYTAENWDPWAATHAW